MNISTIEAQIDAAIERTARMSRAARAHANRAVGQSVDVAGRMICPLCNRGTFTFTISLSGAVSGGCDQSGCETRFHDSLSIN